MTVGIAASMMLSSALVQMMDFATAMMRLGVRFRSLEHGEHPIGHGVSAGSIAGPE